VGVTNKARGPRGGGKRSPAMWMNTRVGVDEVLACAEGNRRNSSRRGSTSGEEGVVGAAQGDSEPVAETIVRGGTQAIFSPKAAVPLRQRCRDEANIFVDQEESMQKKPQETFQESVTPLTGGGKKKWGAHDLSYSQ